MTTHFDHLVIAALSLDEGHQYIQDTLGVDIPLGGKHAAMGTHNRIMQLSPSTYLEIIAIEPEAPQPGHPRWFGLDQAWMQEKLSRSPQLVHWVANVDDLIETLSRTKLHYGIPTLLKRDQLAWKITLPEDGSIPLSGVLPSLIEWQIDTHPAKGMANLNCSLLEINLFHMHAEWLTQKLEEIQAHSLVNIKSIDRQASPYIEARIACPKGEVSLISNL